MKRKSSKLRSKSDNNRLLQLKYQQINVADLAPKSAENKSKSFSTTLPSLSFNKSQQAEFVLFASQGEQKDFDFQNLRQMLKSEILVLSKFVDQMDDYSKICGMYQNRLDQIRDEQTEQRAVLTPRKLWYE